jgi:hypothetical protein
LGFGFGASFVRLALSFFLSLGFALGIFAGLCIRGGLLLLVGLAGIRIRFRLGRRGNNRWGRFRGRLYRDDR